MTSGQTSREKRGKGQGLALKLDLLGTVDVGGVGENADRHPGAGDVGKLDGSRETGGEVKCELVCRLPLQRASEPARGSKVACRFPLRRAITRPPVSIHSPLVTLGVVVLETDLELDGLDEVTLLSALLLHGRGTQEGVDESSHAGR